MKETTTVNLACGVAKCTDRLSLTVETEHLAISRIGALQSLRQAALDQGWRLNTGERNKGSTVCCPFHAKDLRCARCLAARDQCGCMGGPRWEAVPGEAGDDE